MVDYDLRSSIGYLSNKINSLLRIIINRAYKSHGFKLTLEHFTIMAFIYNNPDSTQSELSKLSLRDKTNVTRIIDSLEKQDLVKRKSDPSDRRVFKISITAKGINTLEKLVPIMIKTNKMAEKNISPNELKIVKKVLKTILEELKKII